MKRYSIIVAGPDTPEAELCQCDTNPDEIAGAAALMKRRKGEPRGPKNRRYTEVFVRDNFEGGQ